MGSDRAGRSSLALTIAIPLSVSPRLLSAPRQHDGSRDAAEGHEERPWEARVVSPGVDQPDDNVRDEDRYESVGQSHLSTVPLAQSTNHLRNKSYLSRL